MNDAERAIISAKLLVCTDAIRSLAERIKLIEEDVLMTANQKINIIKIIRQEIVKVGIEIDKIKKIVMMYETFSVN